MTRLPLSQAARSVILSLALIFCLINAPRHAAADPPAETMRVLLAKYRAAAVTLSVVVRTSGTGSSGGDDAEVEVAGFVIDPSGLVVTTNTAIDPASTFASQMGGAENKMTTRVVSARILVPEGSDIPAKVVLRDTDRNIAFLRPLAPVKTPMTYVDLKAGGKAQIGDPIFFVSRLSQVGNRGTTVEMFRVVTVMEKPRTLYVTNTLALTSMGNPAFNEQGQPLGLVTLKVATGGAKRRTFSANESFLPVIIPAEDVMEEAAQAPQAKDVKDIVEPPAKPSATAKPGTPPGGKKPGSK